MAADNPNYEATEGTTNEGRPRFQLVMDDGDEFQYQRPVVVVEEVMGRGTESERVYLKLTVTTTEYMEGDFGR